MSASAPAPLRSRDATEGELVQQWQGGSEAAGARLYAMFAPRLVARLRAGGGDHHLSEDLTQETWLKATRAIDRFDPVNPFWPWLATIADRTLIDHHRRAQVRKDASTVPLDSVPAGSYVVADHARQVELRMSLDDAVGKLTPVLRQSLRAVDAGGLSPAEAAKEVGAAEATIRQRLRRARECVKQSLGPEPVWGLAPLVWLRHMLWQWRDKCAASPGLPALNACATTAVNLGLAVALVAPSAAIASAMPRTVTFEPSPTTMSEQVTGRVDSTEVDTIGAEQPASRNHDAPPPAPNPVESADDTERADESTGRVVEFDPIDVPATDHTIDQAGRSDKDYQEYGVAVPGPSGEQTSVGLATHDEDPAPEVHDEACELARDGVATYCSS